MFGFNLQRRDQRNQQTNENMRGVTNQLQAALQQMERDRLQKQVQAEHDQDRQFLLQQRDQAQAEHVQDREQEQIQRLILQREQAFKNQGIGDSARQYNRAMPTTSMPVPKLSLQQPQVQYKPPALPSLLRKGDMPADVPSDVNKDAAMFLGGGTPKSPMLAADIYQSPDFALQGGDDIAQYLTDAQNKQATFDVSPDKYRAQAMRTSGYNDAMLTPELFDAIARNVYSADAASQAELDWEQQQHEMDVGLYNSKLQTEDAKRRAMLVPRVNNRGSGRGATRQQTTTTAQDKTSPLVAKAYAAQRAGEREATVTAMKHERDGLLRLLDTAKAAKNPNMDDIENINTRIKTLDNKLAGLERSPINTLADEIAYTQAAKNNNLTVPQEAFAYNLGVGGDISPYIRNDGPPQSIALDTSDNSPAMFDSDLSDPTTFMQAVIRKKNAGHSQLVRDLEVIFQQEGIPRDAELTDADLEAIMNNSLFQKYRRR